MRFTQGISIDGVYFLIPVISLKRDVIFKDKFSEQTEDGVWQRELAGVYFDYTMTVGSSKSFPNADYDAFWEKITEPAEAHEITLPDVSGTYTFTAHIESVSDQYQMILKNGAVITNFTCKFKAKAPARMPT